MNYAIVVGKRFLIFFIFPFYTDFFNHFEVKKSGAKLTHFAEGNTVSQLRVNKKIEL